VTAVGSIITATAGGRPKPGMIQQARGREACRLTKLLEMLLFPANPQAIVKPDGRSRCSQHFGGFLAKC